MHHLEVCIIDEDIQRINKGSVRKWGMHVPITKVKKKNRVELAPGLGNV